jgi:hypothetical protein
VSWMGNEATVMPYPLYNANDEAGTHTGQKALGQAATYGIANGTRWMPAHCDAVLRRHFWFWSDAYNQSRDLNTPEDLLGMHLTSVGRGCNMVLDMSPTPTGLLQSNDVATYAAFGAGQQKLYVDALVASLNGTPGQSTVRARPGRSRDLRVLHGASVLYGAFVWARNSPKWRLLARAVRARRRQGGRGGRSRRDRTARGAEPGPGDQQLHGRVRFLSERRRVSHG